METESLIAVFELESRLLDATLRQHPRLRALFSRDFAGVDPGALAQSYLRLLKLTADYVQYTVPALRAAGNALRDGDDQDRAWSQLFLGYAEGETDEVENYGHHVWALDDMRALGAPEELWNAPPHATAVAYGRFFVEDAGQHPYAVLGAKGVLEHFSIRASDDLVRGVVESGIAEAREAVTFYKHHGVLDIDHVREGDRNLESLVRPERTLQVLQGAHFTSGVYRSLVQFMLPT